MKERKQDRKKKRKRKKKKKKKKSRYSSDDNDDESIISEEEEERKYRRKMKKKRTRRRDDDDDDGSNRTQDEKRARKRHKLLGYSNSDNPFGDSQLSKPFVWHKKNEKDVATGRAERAPTKEEQRQQRDRNLEEIRKVQKRREQRERDKQEQEELRILEQRLREAEQYQDWEAKEEEFNQNQMKRKVVARAKHRRETVLDLLAKNYLVLDPPTKSVHDDPDRGTVENELGSIELERRVPTRVVDEIESLTELEKLQDGIKDFVKMTLDKPYGEFWSELSIVVNAALKRLRRSSNDRRSISADHAVRKELDAMYRDHSSKELKQMASEIHRTIENGHQNGATVDVEFYEKQLDQIREYTARARLRELHRVVLKRHEDLVRKHFGDDDATTTTTTTTNNESTTNHQDEDTTYRMNRDEYDDLMLSPILEDDDGDDDIVDEIEDARQLRDARLRVLRESRERLVRLSRSSSNSENNSKLASKMYAAELEKGNADGEEQLKEGEVMVSGQNYSWADKYRPRKPRFFNRVKTGYEWNKYNRTHYDHDNPPPKTVQGYKFNIFYPDLIDSRSVPQYFLEACADSKDFCILRFHAGPPYEDIAFKIVNREWNKLPRHGFRCVFERGILHLHFNFKRKFYRR